MDYIVLENISWMSLNIFLALIPVFFALLFYKTKRTIMKIIYFAGWLFFVPNTIYVFTDVIHLMEQISETSLLGGIILVAQYAVLFVAGFITYIFSMHLIEKRLKSSSFIIIAINFIIGFGVVIGRIHRFNSWDIIFQTGSVFYAAFETITSFKMFVLAILFGLFANFMYFLLREKFDKICKIRLN